MCQYQHDLDGGVPLPGGVPDAPSDESEYGECQDDEYSSEPGELVCEQPDAGVRQRAASRQHHGDCECGTELDSRVDGPGQVIYVFSENHFPTAAEFDQHLAGFDDWAIFTMEQPILESYTGTTAPPMPFLFEVPPEEPQMSYAGPVSGGVGSALLRANWPYYYRFLAGYDASIAQIAAGADLFPVPLQAGRTFQPAASRAEMTFRHLRPSGNVPQIGTNRISTGNNMSVIYNESLGRGTGEIVRIDPRIVGREGETFLSARDLLNDLDEMERAIQQELAELRRTNAGANKIRRVEGRLSALQQARTHALRFGEGHGVGRVPSRAMGGVGSMRAEMAGFRVTQGLKVAGGVLIVYGVYSSLDRIAEAPEDMRGRVATQEVGGWAGGLAGAWAVGQIFAAGGAALGIETGPGAILTGLAGGIIGGIVGGIGGALGADWVYSLMEEDTARDCCPKAVGRPMPDPRDAGWTGTRGGSRVWREPVGGPGRRW